MQIHDLFLQFCSCLLHSTICFYLIIPSKNKLKVTAAKQNVNWTLMWSVKDVQKLNDFEDANLCGIMQKCSFPKVSKRISVLNSAMKSAKICRNLHKNLKIHAKVWRSLSFKIYEKMQIYGQKAESCRNPQVQANPWVPVHTWSGWCCSSLKNYVWSLSNEPEVSIIQNISWNNSYRYLRMRDIVQLYS